MAISKKDIREAGDPIENRNAYWMLEREHGQLPPWIVEKMNRDTPLREYQTLAEGSLGNAYFLRSDESLPPETRALAAAGANQLEAFLRALEVMKAKEVGAPKNREHIIQLFHAGYLTLQEARNQAQKIYAQQDRQE
jgi:hypothetical protein